MLEAWFISENIISKFVSVAETEILSILGNKVPISPDFLADFGALCLEINQSREFCKKIAFSSLIEFHDSRLIFEEQSNTLVLKSKVKMPIVVSHNFTNELSLFKILNIGYFDGDNNIHRLVLPEFILKSNNDDTVYAMRETCHYGICPVNGLSINAKSSCSESLFVGNTDSCRVEVLESKDKCDFIRIPNTGTLITASKARFVESNTAFISKTNDLINTTVFYESDGTLECIRSKSGRTSFHPIKTHSSHAGEFSLRQPQMLKLNLNVSEFEIFSDNQQSLKSRLETLELNHNNAFMKLGQFQISTYHLGISFIMIVWAIISIFLVILNCKNRKKISDLQKAIFK